MNRKNTTKEERIKNAEKNLVKRINGTTTKKHPEKITHPHLGNGKRRNHKK